MNPIPTNPTMSDLVTILREHHTILTTILQKENAMPCGVSTTTTTTTQCASPMAPFFECCGRLKVQAFKCEAPTGCAGATFPVGLQLNVNEWASMGEYPVYAAKFFDCVGGKAYVGILGAVNGVVKYGLDVRVPNTANATAIRLSIVDPTTGAIIEGQEINIGLAPATDSDGVSSSGTTSPGLVLDSGVTITGPFEATIGTPDKSVWEGFWYPSTQDQGVLLTTEQRAWHINGAKLDTGVSAVKTVADDGFTLTAIDVVHGTATFFAGTHPQSNSTIGALAYAPTKVPTITGGMHAAIWSSLIDENWETSDTSAGLSVVFSDGTRYAGWFDGNIYVSGNATLGGNAFGGWADYVLKPDYELMPLPKLREYITEFTHLPDVPTANQVAASGLSIGNIFKTLLLKIEESTLYILQLEERLSALEA